MTNQNLSPKSDAERQRLHVERKKDRAFRLQCWIGLEYQQKLRLLAEHLEDSQASLIEQGIELLYQQELNSNLSESQQEVMSEEQEESLG
ncbi:hypothetical protein [Dongshaea marina]|uniref:hypothetical protein n=1 Tax=Dongshaea marina TaxID=2047966 RepID=UPI000D3E3FC0|nr:hypothetical protein [Dongshaea marina]